MRDEVTEAVKQAIVEAALAYLGHHRFLVETKKGQDFIVWSSSIYNKHYSDFYLQTRDADFIKYAEKAGFDAMRRYSVTHIPSQNDVFNESIGKAMMTFMASQKANPMEIEMQEIQTTAIPGE
ncbi:MAG: hypothetical protein Q8L78_07695 [Coxiellaceae bacterium]|nr:hypothetical protein [Coxiellaceae bacterium]